jgi:hypothetical protein
MIPIYPENRENRFENIFSHDEIRAIRTFAQFIVFCGTMSSLNSRNLCLLVPNCMKRSMCAYIHGTREETGGNVIFEMNKVKIDSYR